MRTIAIFALIFSMLAPIAGAVGDEPAQATLRVKAGAPAGPPISKFLTGKFTEHLGSNVYNGIDAQILRNPTFAAWGFPAGESSPDGVGSFHYERDRIAEIIKNTAIHNEWPTVALDRLAQDYADGLACWWTRAGERRAVRVSADAAPFGQRAQRVELTGPGQGIAQWVWLPLHRVRRYEFELYLRSPNIKAFRVTLGPEEGKGAEASAKIERAEARTPNDGWGIYKGTLELGVEAPADAPCRFAILADGPGQFVIGRALLRPGDHVGGVDADVLKNLEELHPPILRWPGGNFASEYHWEHGVGPVERRPTTLNTSWGGVETHLFGTDNFIALCRRLGAEPLICVNAGSGSPEEAARWIEYCNGAADSPLGRLRAAGGHPEPYRVKYWEVGNELYGHWQVHWTTPQGYADRYVQFARAMRRADPSIELLACGTPIEDGGEWNRALIQAAGKELTTIASHVLLGGSVERNADMLDVFRDTMAVPQALERKWAVLRDQMKEAGIAEPRLAITELQLFARYPGRGGEGGRAYEVVGNFTISEALYDVLIDHAAVRLAPFIQIITQSATVNHGGGMSKRKERVWVHPCHWGQAGFAALAGATPVEIELQAPEAAAPRVLPGLRGLSKGETCKTVDAVAAVAPGGDLLISIVHRAAKETTRLSVTLEGFEPGARAAIHELSAPVPWAANTFEQPDAVRPVDYEVEIKDNALTLDLKPCSVSVIRLKKR